ncbi:hypothetical protein P879_03953 [Paragonimus westermani]|uniref:Uncharacterized protein n=1 Tax=Paragonimus westermani TaxID=34504 RepID=A0A8T0D204_9TREM|nr:hypothetical protein P879_03953 [Paragonimus westermani]
MCTPYASCSKQSSKQLESRDPLNFNQFLVMTRIELSTATSSLNVTSLYLHVLLP